MFADFLEVLQSLVVCLLDPPDSRLVVFVVQFDADEVTALLNTRHTGAA